MNYIAPSCYSCHHGTEEANFIAGSFALVELAQHAMHIFQSIILIIGRTMIIRRRYLITEFPDRIRATLIGKYKENFYE